MTDNVKQPKQSPRGQLMVLTAAAVAAVIARWLGLGGGWALLVFLAVSLAGSLLLSGASAGQYAGAWSQWLKQWRPRHILGILTSSALVFASALFGEGQMVLSIGLLASAVVALAVTPIGSMPVFGEQESRGSVLDELRSLLGAHREGKARAEAARREFYRRERP